MAVGILNELRSRPVVKDRERVCENLWEFIDSMVVALIEYARVKTPELGNVGAGLIAHRPRCGAEVRTVKLFCTSPRAAKALVSALVIPGPAVVNSQADDQ